MDFHFYIHAMQSAEAKAKKPGSKKTTKAEPVKAEPVKAKGKK